MQNETQLQQQEIYEQPPVLVNARKSSFVRSGVITKQKVTKVISPNQKYLICECAYSQKIIVYDIEAHSNYNIKVNSSEFYMFQFPQFLFCCAIGQCLYLWEAAIFENYKIPARNFIHPKQNISPKKIQPQNAGCVRKARISRINIKVLANTANGAFIAGENKSVLVGKKKTNRRSIYYVEKLDYKKSNKPIYEIQLPKSSQYVTILLRKGIYLACYMNPNTYVINAETSQILIQFTSNPSILKFLIQRYQAGELTLLGINKLNRTCFTATVQNFPVYGVEISEFRNVQVNSCCISGKSGRVFLTDGKTIFQYDLHKQIKIQEFNPKFQNNNSEVVQIIWKSDCELIAVKQIGNIPSSLSLDLNEFDCETKSDTYSEGIKTRDTEAKKYWCIEIIYVGC